MSPRRLGILAWSGVAASAALAGSSIWLASTSGTTTGVFEVTPGSAVSAAAIGLGILTFAVVGAIVASRKPENPIGWLFLAAGTVLEFGNFSGTYSFHALDSNPGSLPGGAIFGLLSDTLWLPSIAFTTVFLFLLFPGGKSTTRTSVITLRVAIAGTVAATLGGLTEVHLYAAPSIRNPLGNPIPRVATDVLSGIGFFVIVGCTLVAVASLIRRLRRSRGEEREQLKWFVYAAAAVLVTSIPANLFNTPPIWLQIVSGSALIGLPVSVGIAILKYRLYDIDVVINKALVYGALAAFVTLIYVGMVVGIGALVGTQSDPVLSAVAAAVVALAFQPARRRAQHFADRLVYGKRATPYEVLTSFSERVAETYAIEDILPRMVRILADGVGAERASVWLRVGDRLRATASTSDAPSPPLVLVDDGLPAFPDRENAVEVRHQGELLGALSVRMTASDPMDHAKEQLIHDLAAQAGLVLRNVRLIEDLRDSRRRLVTAQDEERRRLERDIHDGAQQQLVALSVKHRLLAGLIGTDDDRARGLVQQLLEDTNDALQNLRDLARGIYPPLLADKGLADALAAQARKIAIPIEISANGAGRYPQEVEAAVYFCVLEALQNVTKYANASRATVRIEAADGLLTFVVQDDGEGFDPQAAGMGTGLQGMTDRLEAIGGSLQVDSHPGSGTTITGRVPARTEAPGG